MFKYILKYFKNICHYLESKSKSQIMLIKDKINLIYRKEVTLFLGNFTD